MCPDSQLLSAYYDGEFDGKHEEALSRHIESCADCQLRIEEFRALSTVLEQAPVPPSETSARRSWEHIRIRAAALSGASLWRRTVFVPAPVAFGLAAAVVLLVATLVLSVGTDLFGPDTAETHTTFARGPMSLSEAVWKYLDEQQAPSQFVVTFPGDMERIISRPAFVRAADYRRGEE